MHLTLHHDAEGRTSRAVRTTIDLETVLLERARRRAVNRGVTLSQLVCEAVSAYLNEGPERRDEQPFDLLTCGDPGAGYAPSPAAMSEALLDEERVRPSTHKAGSTDASRRSRGRARA